MIHKYVVDTISGLVSFYNEGNNITNDCPHSSTIGFRQQPQIIMDHKRDIECAIRHNLGDVFPFNWWDLVSTNKKKVDGSSMVVV